MPLPVRAASVSVSMRDATLVAFIVAQTLDALLTYRGLAVFGMTAEANPVVAWYVSMLGAAGGLAVVKLLSVGCALALHRLEQDRILGGLTMLCVGVAVLPWARLLWL
jgi:hypothetical protein